MDKPITKEDDDLQAMGSDPMIERLMRRDRLRQEEVMRRRAAAETNKPKSENVERFRSDLEEKCSHIQASLNCVSRDDTPVEQCSDLDDINQQLMHLKQFISKAATLFLIPYEVSRADKQFRELEQQYHRIKSDLLPKKSFMFTSRKVGMKKQNVDKTVVPQSTATPPPFETKIDDARSSECSVSYANKKGENLVITHEEVYHKDISLTQLEDCTVQITGVASSLIMSSLKNCKVFCGPVASAIFMEDCFNCKFQLSCQQLRVHKTEACDIYLHVVSRAIIEDSTKVRFAPYNWEYAQIDAHFELAGFDKNAKNWDAVDDFNWLAHDKHSPNWQILSENERVSDWNLNGSVN